MRLIHTETFELRFTAFEGHYLYKAAPELFIPAPTRPYNSYTFSRASLDLLRAAIQRRQNFVHRKWHSKFQFPGADIAALALEDSYLTDLLNCLGARPLPQKRPLDPKRLPQ